MRVADAYLELKKSLPALEARILLCHVGGFSNEEVVFAKDGEISLEKWQKLQELCQKRLEKVPISHLINRREFFGLEFFVDERVLDPRPDSEILVEEVLSRKPKEILEIGTGSGCLTISLLQNLENCKALGVDVSEEAMAVCRRNIAKFNLEERFLLQKSDIFAKIDEGLRFDAIISNPPYIKSAEIEELQDEVRIFEPRIALDGGGDGLDFYRRIALGARGFLSDGGFVALEIGCEQKEDVVRIFAGAGFVLDGARRDFGDRDRVLVFV